MYNESQQTQQPRASFTEHLKSDNRDCNSKQHDSTIDRGVIERASENREAEGPSKNRVFYAYQISNFGLSIPDSLGLGRVSARLKKIIRQNLQVEITSRYPGSPGAIPTCPLVRDNQLIWWCIVV